MENSILSSDHEIQAMRDLMKRLGEKSTVVDFEEQILLAASRASLRLWKHNDQLLGFAYVDAYNNLWFDTEPENSCPAQLEAEIVAWGAACLKSRSPDSEAGSTLDCCCRSDNHQRVQLLERHAFSLQPIRSLRYARSLTEPVKIHPLPAGFSIRCVNGEDEVDPLVALHRAAFGTDYMTNEERLAIMSAPQYVREMDLIAVAPNGELAAFCIGGFSDPEHKTGYTDPIGTHPHYQQLGLAKAIVSFTLRRLQNAGAQSAELGTSSENIALQKLADALGFTCVSEKLWFSKNIL
jgi:mycothiol synthase